MPFSVAIVWNTGLKETMQGKDRNNTLLHPWAGADLCFKKENQLPGLWGDWTASPVVMALGGGRGLCSIPGSFSFLT